MKLSFKFFRIGMMVHITQKIRIRSLITESLKRRNKSTEFAELNEALGQGNEFYLRFLDKDGNIIGEDYFYFVPYTSPNP